jgi:hypothetical protein
MGFSLQARRRALWVAPALAVWVGAVAAPSPQPYDSGTPGASTHALENATFYFRTEDGSVLTLLMLELLNVGDGAASVAGGAVPTYAGAASVEESGRRGEELPGSVARAVPLEIAPAVVGPGRATFFGRVYLRSGRTYSVRYVVKDAARNEILIRNALLGVPYLDGGFSASSVVPAERFGPSGPGIDGFPVGSDEVVPKAGGVFRRSELLRLYLQVYDAKPNPETLTPRVDIVFRFYRSVNRSSKRYGKPLKVRGATGASIGLALPIGDWPTGLYRVEVDLHDRVAAARITTEGSFSIVAD